MENALDNPRKTTVQRARFFSAWPQAYLNFFGKKIIAFLAALYGLGAFALITMVVIVKKNRHASRVIHPLVFKQIRRAGLQLLPMTSFLALALGFVIIGQT
ncbi:MAG: hypothetical protein ABJC04_10450, partial [Verrucomicrobiota bacterium]